MIRPLYECDSIPGGLSLPGVVNSQSTSGGRDCETPVTVNDDSVRSVCYSQKSLIFHF
jgi:hypothetical protein